MTESSDLAEFRNVVSALRESASAATTDDEMRALTGRIAMITRAYRIQHGIGLPVEPLEQAMEVEPNFRPREHLAYLSSEVAAAVRDVERGKNRQIAVSMPPRAGKSTLLSLFTPMWLLRRHPEWKIVMAGNDSALVISWARHLRRIIESKPDLGIAISPDGGGGASWSTMEQGGMFATSVRGPLTGRGARVLIIDDPVKDFVEAHSPAMRQNLWEWWLSVALTRLEPPYLVLVVMCMTGDTQVLRADAIEVPLRDIRPGDEIATYEDGRLTTSRVVNWANQGPDDIFEVRMESGRTVKANARHPFLTVDENGVETWRRTDQLEPGSRVLSAVAPGSESPAPQRAATSPSPARGSVGATTTRLAGLRAIDLLQSIQSRAVRLGSSIATASRLLGTSLSPALRTAGAPSAGRPRSAPVRPPTGTGNSASTTIRSQGRSEDSSATTATSSSSGTSRQTVCAQPPSTWSVIPDRVVSVTPAGREDVFDLQVERTENFIANGLVSHNTRWHEDDFIGRLFSNEYEGDPRQWQRISLPAVAERDDSLGRPEGAPLLSPLVDETAEQAVERWDDVRKAIGTYTFASMYQQRPSPPAGVIFDSGWWRYWTTDPAKATEDGRIVYLDPSSMHTARWLDSWDCAFKALQPEMGGWVVGQRWARQGENRYLIAQQRGRWSFTQTIQAMLHWADPDGSIGANFVHERLIEEAANGAAIIDVLREKISGLKPVGARFSKESRARAVTPEVESGHVYVPHPTDPGHEWVTDFLSELRNFPNDVADDQVDALTQALAALRDTIRGGVTVPGRMAPAQAPRNMAQVAMSDMMRRRGAPPSTPGIRRVP